MQTAPPWRPLKTFPEAKIGGKTAFQRSQVLIISIHDVSTVTRSVVEEMIRDLAAVGVATTSLLVIPDHHHQGRVDADPIFSSWLQRQVMQGHEAVLHGYYHLRPQGIRENLVVRLITRSYTAGEGEFYDLSFDAASELLKRGRKVLVSALNGSGVELGGFTAPAWLLGKEAERAVRAEGFDYTTRIGAVFDLRAGEAFASRSMVYSVRSAWRRVISLLWNEILFRWMKSSPVLRIGLHPPDWLYGDIRTHILRCVREAVAVREVKTYGKWLARERNSGHQQGHS